MKKIVLFLMSFVSLHAFSQLEGRFGFTGGATQYNTNTNMLLSKSGTGFSVGLVGTAEINDVFRVLTEINYNRHSTRFTGRENNNSPTEDISFKIENFSVPILAEYNFYKHDDFFFSFQAGPSLHFIYDYTLKDYTYEDHVLDPFYASPQYLQFDTRRDEISINIFAAAGLNADYDDNFRLGLRYYYGITDPYRHSNLYSVEEITGQDSYFALKFTYFLDD